MSVTKNGWTLSQNTNTGNYTLECTGITTQNKTILLNTNDKLMKGDLRVNISMATASPSASVSSLSAPTVTVSGTANGFTASSSATSYYVTINGSVTANGSVKAKYTNSSAGYAAQNTSGTESSASSISATISGDGNKVYIPVSGTSVSTDYSGDYDRTISITTYSRYINISAGYSAAKYILLNPVNTSVISGYTVNEATKGNGTSNSSSVTMYLTRWQMAICCNSSTTIYCASSSSGSFSSKGTATSGAVIYNNGSNWICRYNESSNLTFTCQSGTDDLYIKVSTDKYLRKIYSPIFKGGQ